jgi:enamine deaminase RidA (YjgF/YER057c/UK114 family)
MRIFAPRVKPLVTPLAVLGLFIATAPAHAQDVMRVPAVAATSPLAALVAVPPGYTTYYISGALATPMTPAANGKPADWGDIAYQTASVLDSLQATMAKAGLDFGDVVQAHVFMAPDPAKGGGMDFAGMNKVWLTRFGTPTQPNKPARAAFKVAALAADGPLLEIEFIAVKRAPGVKKPL